MDVKNIGKEARSIDIYQQLTETRERKRVTKFYNYNHLLSSTVSSLLKHMLGPASHLQHNDVTNRNEYPTADPQDISNGHNFYFVKDFSSSCQLETISLPHKG